MHLFPQKGTLIPHFPLPSLVDLDLLYLVKNPRILLASRIFASQDQLVQIAKKCMRQGVKDQPECTVSIFYLMTRPSQDFPIERQVSVFKKVTFITGLVSSIPFEVPS